MIASQFAAAPGALLVETREEARALALAKGDVPASTLILTVAAPSGALRCGTTGRPMVIDAKGNAVPCTPGQLPTTGLAAGYAWASSDNGRLLVVWDWHAICNAPGQWRQLIDVRDALRARGSLACFIGPEWALKPENPLRGEIPMVALYTPSRAELAADALRTAEEQGIALNGHADLVADALAGLTEESARQATAECLVSHRAWDHLHLRGARRSILKEAGLELRQPISPDSYGGAAQLRRYLAEEVIPWSRDSQLAVRRMLFAGLPGTGKTYGAQLLAGSIGCECVVLSVAAAKDQYQGSAARNLLPRLRAVSSISKESPCVVVLDEVDKLTTGHAGDSGSGEAWTVLADHLQEDKSRAIYIGTANWVERLDPALLQRFGEGWFFELPTAAERESIAGIHLGRLGCLITPEALSAMVSGTIGYSARELAERVCPSLARLSGRAVRPEHVERVLGQMAPASASQQDQLANMRSTAGQLRPANDRENASTIAKTGPSRRLGN